MKKHMVERDGKIKECKDDWSWAQMMSHCRTTPRAIAQHSQTQLKLNEIQTDWFHENNGNDAASAWDEVWGCFVHSHRLTHDWPSWNGLPAWPSVARPAVGCSRLWCRPPVDQRADCRVPAARRHCGVPLQGPWSDARSAPPALWLMPGYWRLTARHILPWQHPKLYADYRAG